SGESRGGGTRLLGCFVEEVEADDRGLIEQARTNVQRQENQEAVAGRVCSAVIIPDVSRDLSGDRQVMAGIAGKYEAARRGGRNGGVWRERERLVGGEVGAVVPLDDIAGQRVKLDRLVSGVDDPADQVPSGAPEWQQISSDSVSINRPEPGRVWDIGGSVTGV